MREILFRGKRIDNTKWIFGSVATFRNIANEVYTAVIPFVDGENVICSLKRVIPETVGQYTGLTDKSGTKIFEGDILFYEYGEVKKRGFVFYYDRGAKFGIKENDGYDNLSLLHDTQVSSWNIKVIGNIHDNPELLKGGD